MDTNLEKSDIGQSYSWIEHGSLKQNYLFTQPLSWQNKPNVIFSNCFGNISNALHVPLKEFIMIAEHLSHLIKSLSERVVYGWQLHLSIDDDIDMIKFTSFSKNRLARIVMIFMEARKNSLFLF